MLMVPGARAATASLTPSDSDKQCSDGINVQTGTEDLEMTMSVTLSGNWELANSPSVSIVLPFRLTNYSGSLGSLVLANDHLVDTANYSVRVVIGGTTYWGHSLALSSSTTADTVTASFTGSSTIATSTVVDVIITGVTNPPSTEAFSGVVPTIISSGVTRGTDTFSITPCVKETNDGSASAVVGSDRISQTGATYRFQFKSYNVYPVSADLQVTITDFTFSSSQSYTMECLTGCVTPSTASVTGGDSDSISFTDIFTSATTAGTFVDFTITGFTNPDTETVYSSYFQIYQTSNSNLIDKFESLGALYGTESIYSAATFNGGNTAILITELAKRDAADCRIIPPLKHYATLALSSSQQTVNIETASDKFSATGGDCMGRSSFKVSAYARLEDGSLLNGRYAIPTYTAADTNNYVNVVLTPSADSRSTTTSHAVYVKVQDSANTMSANIICFMMTDDTTENFCRSFCQENLLYDSQGSRPESLDYFISQSGSNAEVSYPDEFALMTQNKVMCPILYSYEQTTSESNEALVNFDVSTGSFGIQTDLTSKQATYESYSIMGYTDAFSKQMPLTTYFSGCDQATVVISETIDISIFLPSGSDVSYTYEDFGLESSDPDNCPLSGFSTLSLAFCNYVASACSGTSLTNYWDSTTNTLRVYRNTLTDLSTQNTFEVQVTVSFGSTAISFETYVNFEISDCDTNWNCASCDSSLLSYNALLTTDNQSWITENTSGCTTCNTDYHLEYGVEANSGDTVRHCVADSETKTTDTPCGLGLLYDTDQKSYLCQVTCNDVMPGCALCSDATTCYGCIDPLYVNTALTDSDGNTYYECILDTSAEFAASDYFESSTTDCTTNCQICTDVTSGTSQCQVCDRGYYIDGTECTAYTSSSTFTYFVEKATADQTSWTTAEISSINSATGASGSKFSFLQQVFNTVYSDASILTASDVTVTVTLDAGDHFVFSCHNDLYADYITTDSAGVTDLCAEIPSLSQNNPPTDNVSFEFVVDGTDETTIFVMDPYYNFNVTGSMSFTGINFSGLHALATLSDTNSIPTIPPLATIPVKKCDFTEIELCQALPQRDCRLTNEPTAPTWGTHISLDLGETTTATDLTGLFTCADEDFSSHVPPMTDAETCTTEADTDTIESVRSCPGEPYHEDFFTFDSVTEIPYKRHKVLFNLYNFDLLSSSSATTKYASLKFDECSFKYFLSDYEGLINIETNNMAIVEPVDESSKTLLLKLGDDRGVDIRIDNSEFSHSRFCKGMLVYKRSPTLASTDDITVFKLDDIVSDSSDESKILIVGSTFDNLNFGKTLTTFSLLNSTLPMTGLSAIEYPTFDNHGSVLNLQGYPGGVQMQTSTVENNMVFIPDIYPSKRSSADTAEQIQYYKNELTGQIRTTRCTSDNLTKRLFSDFFTSLMEQNVELVTQFERHSPIYIAYQRNPVVFLDNTFENNIGLFGGVISLDTPNFVDDAIDDPDLDPVTLIQGNMFNHTQAYLSGNAVYMKSTFRRETDNEAEENCGGGLSLFQNTFQDLTPILQSSNGGAVSLECDFVSATGSASLGASNVNTYMQAVLFSSMEPNQYSGKIPAFKGAKSAVIIDENVFTRTSTGQKGTAIYSRQISNIIMKNNVFEDCRPSLAVYNSTAYMPYQERLLGIHYERPFFYYNPDVPANTDEFVYMRQYATSYDNGGLIDMPQTQGLIYTEMCQTCLLDYVEGYDSLDGCSFCPDLPHKMVIQDNTFTNNYDDYMLFYEDHDLPRANLLFARGGTNYEIVRNTITHSWSETDSSSNLLLSNYYTNLPAQYFTSLRSPIMRLDIPDATDVTFSENTVSGISLVQPLWSSLHYSASLLLLENATGDCALTVSSNVIDDFQSVGGDASMIYVGAATLTARENVFTRIGKLDHGTYNFTQDYDFESTAEYYPVQMGDWDARSWTNGKGIFEMQAGKRTSSSLEIPQVHNITNNRFSYVFCDEGCVFSHRMSDSSQATYFQFSDNSYSDIFAEQGAVLYSKIDSRSDNGTYAVFNITGDSFERVQNGALLVEGYSHDIVTFLKDISFTDCYGDDNHGVLDFSEGAFFTLKNCGANNTNVDPADKVQRTQELFEDTYTGDYSVIFRDSFTDYLEANTSDSLFNTTNSQKGVYYLSGFDQTMSEINITAINVTEVSLYDRLEPDYFFQEFVWREFEGNMYSDVAAWLAANVTSPIFDSWYEGMPDFVPNSFITNTTFSGVDADQAYLTLKDSRVLFRTTNFTDNNFSSDESSTLRVIGDSVVTFGEDCGFIGNSAGQGAAISVLDGAQVIGEGTVFRENYAKINGGVLYLEAAGNVTFDNVLIANNTAAGEGAVLWATNGQEGAMTTIVDSSFEGNKAMSSMMKLTLAQMSISNSVFVNNFADEITHGFSLNEANLTVANTIIRNQQTTTLSQVSSRLLLPSLKAQIFSDVLHPFHNRHLQTESEQSVQAKVLAGFFYLTEQSNLELTYSQLEGTTGDIASVAYAISGSSVSVNGARLTYLDAPQECKFENSAVLVGKNAASITVSDSSFKANDCSYIYSDRTPVAVNRTIFSESVQKPYINVKGSVLSIQNSTLMASSVTDQKSSGRGVLCTMCKQVYVRDSRFMDLYGYHGGAVSLIDSIQGYFEGNLFERNSAKQGGAIYSQNSEIDLKGNSFVENNAINTTYVTDDQIDKILEQQVNKTKAEVFAEEVEVQKSNLLSVALNEGKGGAIFFTCTDPQDDFSEFVTTLPICADGEDTTEDGGECKTQSIDDEPGALELKSAFQTKCNMELEKNDFTGNKALDAGNNIFWTNRDESKIIPPSGCVDTELSDGRCIQYPATDIRFNLIDTTYVYTNETETFQQLQQDDDTIIAGFTVASGRPFVFEIILVDKNGDDYTYDDTSGATLTFIPVENPDELNKNNKIISNFAQAQRGVYNFTNLDITLVPGSIGLVELTIDKFEKYSNSGDKDAIPFVNGENPYKIMLYARQCKEGEEFRGDMTCADCPLGYYSFTPLVEVSECPICPQYGDCDIDRGSLLPQKGYARFDEDSEVFVRCFYDEACQLGSPEAKLKNCASGYDGVLCASCAHGFWKPWGTYYCYKCDSDILQLIKRIVLPILMGLIIFAVVKQILRKWHGQKNQETVGILRILINMYQILTIMTIQPDDTTTVASNLFLKGYLDRKIWWLTPMFWFIDIQCLDTWLDNSPAERFYLTLQLYSAFPFILLFFNTIIWLLYGCIVQRCYPNITGNRFVVRKVMNRIAISFGISMWLVYPTITGFLLQCLKCFGSLEEGPGDVIVKRLDIAPDVICSDTKYYVHLTVLVIPGLILYNIVLPFLALRKLNTYASQIYSSVRPNIELKVKDKNDINDAKCWFGFFFYGLNLGGETYEKERKAKVDYASANKADQQDNVDTGPSLGEKCGMFFTRISDPLNGQGVEIEVSTGERVIVPKYSRSFYYWEFVMFFYKLLLQCMVVFMSDFNQGLQSNLMLLVTFIFFAIQLTNAPYYTKGLNVLSMTAQLVVLLFVFLRVYIKVTDLNSGTLPEDADYLGAVTGSEIDVQFKDISRAKEFQSGTELFLLPVTVPFILITLINDGIFIWNLYLQILIFFVEQEMFKMFRMFTLNIWRLDAFRARYMGDTLDAGAGGRTGGAGEFNMRLGNRVMDGDESEDNKEIVAPEQIDAELLGNDAKKSSRPASSRSQQKQGKKKRQNLKLAMEQALENVKDKDKNKIQKKGAELGLDEIFANDDNDDKVAGNKDRKSKDRNSGNRNTGMPSTGRDAPTSKDDDADDIKAKEIDVNDDNQLLDGKRKGRKGLPRLDLDMDKTGKGKTAGGGRPLQLIDSDESLQDGVDEQIENEQKPFATEVQESARSKASSKGKKKKGKKKRGLSSRSSRSLHQQYTITENTSRKSDSDDAQSRGFRSGGTKSVMSRGSDFDKIDSQSPVKQRKSRRQAIADAFKKAEDGDDKGGKTRNNQMSSRRGKSSGGVKKKKGPFDDSDSDEDDSKDIKSKMAQTFKSLASGGQGGINLFAPNSFTVKGRNFKQDKTYFKKKDRQ